MLAARGAADGGVRHAAILGVTTYVNGKKHYQHLAYLGAYYESGNIFDAAEFWDRVEAKLDGLRLTPDDYTMAVAAIERRLPRPTAKELKAARQRAAKAVDGLSEAVAASALALRKARAA
jgi:hypothetical protein